MTETIIIVLFIFACIVATLGVELGRVKRHLRKTIDSANCMYRLYLRQDRVLQAREEWMRNAIVWISRMEAPPDISLREESKSEATQ